MNKVDVTKFINQTKAAVSKHSPEILTGIGIAGMITSTVLAVKATPKALMLIDEEKERQQTKELPVLDTVKVAWKPYVPAAVTGTLAIGCLVGASSVSARRNAALTAAYQLSTTALSEYKEKVVETIGEKKERVIHEELAKDKLKQNPIDKKEVIFTGKGDTLCFDAMTGRAFKSDKIKIEKAVNELNRRMNAGAEMYISLNEFYNEIGLPAVPFGEDLGWRIDKGLIDIHYSAILTEDDEPCMVIEFLVPPEYGFNKLY